MRREDFALFFSEDVDPVTATEPYNINPPVLSAGNTIGDTLTVTDGADPEDWNGEPTLVWGWWVEDVHQSDVTGLVFDSTGRVLDGQTVYFAIWPENHYPEHLIVLSRQMFAPETTQRHLEYRHSWFSASLTSVPIGTAFDGRLMYIMSTGAGTISGVLVDTVAGTQKTSVAPMSGRWLRTWTANPSGSSAESQLQGTSLSNTVSHAMTIEGWNPVSTTAVINDVWNGDSVTVSKSVPAGYEAILHGHRYGRITGQPDGTQILKQETYEQNTDNQKQHIVARWRNETASAQDLLVTFAVLQNAAGNRKFADRKFGAITTLEPV